MQFLVKNVMTPSTEKKPAWQGQYATPCFVQLLKPAPPPWDSDIAFVSLPVAGYKSKLDAHRFLFEMESYDIRSSTARTSRFELRAVALRRSPWCWDLHGCRCDWSASCSAGVLALWSCYPFLGQHSSLFFPSVLLFGTCHSLSLWLGPCEACANGKYLHPLGPPLSPTDTECWSASSAHSPWPLAWSVLHGQALLDLEAQGLPKPGRHKEGELQRSSPPSSPWKLSSCHQREFLSSCEHQAIGLPKSVVRPLSFLQGMQPLPWHDWNPPIPILLPRRELASLLKSKAETIRERWDWCWYWNYMKLRWWSWWLVANLGWPLLNLQLSNHNIFAKLGLRYAWIHWPCLDTLNIWDVWDVWGMSKAGLKMGEGRLFSCMAPAMEEASMGAMAWQRQCGHSSRLGMFEALGNKRCKQLHKLANKQTTTIAILQGSSLVGWHSECADHGQWVARTLHYLYTSIYILYSIWTLPPRLARPLPPS